MSHFTSPSKGASKSVFTQSILASFGLARPEKVSSRRWQHREGFSANRSSLAPAPADDSKVSFLDSWGEAILLGIPLLSFALTLGFWLLGRINLSWRITDVASLLVTLIFMDGVHVVFTFMLLVSVPELWKWSTSHQNRPEKGWARGLGFWVRLTFVSVFLAILVYVLRVEQSTAMVRGMMAAWLFLELLGPAQHTLAQMRGISFCYHSTIRKRFQLSDEEKHRAARTELAERYLFKALLFGELFFWIPQIFGPDQLVVPGLELLKYAGGILTCVSAVGLVLNGLRFPRQAETRKSLFLTRVLLFPLKMFNSVAGLGVRATHGTEYLVIFRQMVNGSNLSQARRKRIYWMTFAASVAYSVIFILTWPVATRDLSGWAAPQQILNVALVTTFVIRFAHYWTDSVLYKMSNPLTRAAVSPLLVPMKAASSPRASG
jgi:hypothetical protein